MVRSTSQNPPNDRGESADDAINEVVGEVLLAVLKVVAMLGWWGVRYPILSIPAAACALLGYRFGWPTGVGAVLAWSALMVGWRLLQPDSFRRWAWWPIVARWRRWIYRHRWAKICALHGLTAELDGTILVPRLQRIAVGVHVDVLTVRMVAGQTHEDWHKCTVALAHALRARTVTATNTAPGQLKVTVARTDRLAAPIPVPTPAAAPDLHAVRIGVRDDGREWTVRVLGRHLLIAGATGAGKGSVLWAVLAGLAAQIRSGVVSVRAIDPKGGMELAPGAGLFDAFAYDTGDQMLGVLRDAAATLTERAQRLRGHTRLHTPTTAEPLIVLVIDEIATLTSYITDRKIRTEVEQLLGLILSQGRAVGVSVLAAVQDPSKDVLSMRQLFPTRIGLRMAESTQVAMVLGHGARERGAHCDEIPDTLPGVAYVAEDGTADPMRVRAFHVTDRDISHLVHTYRRDGDTGQQQPCETRSTSPGDDWGDHR